MIVAIEFPIDQYDLPRLVDTTVVVIVVVAVYNSFSYVLHLLVIRFGLFSNPTKVSILVATIRKTDDDERTNVWLFLELHQRYTGTHRHKHGCSKP